ncbi:MAG: methyltransferase domain-containing protein [Candidatus Aenigmatarchaeota archaeon]
MLKGKIVLLGKEKLFIIDLDQKKFSCQYGFVDLTKIKRYGQKIICGSEELVALKPTMIDLLGKCKRGPQIIMPKDAAQIVATTGATDGWRCLDAGGGSGFLSIFLANIVSPNGRITTYEKEKRNYEIIRYNIRYCSLDKIIKLKNADALRFTEKNLDLVTLDMKDVVKMVPKVFKVLNPGGWLVVYSPHIEQQKDVSKKMRSSGFVQMKTIENIQREWKFGEGGFTHPKPSGIMHTGFLTFGRKV